MSSNLAAWVLALGEVTRAPLTAKKSQAVINDDWIANGVAANTIRHRRRALAQLFDHFDGPEKNPVRKLKAPREPELAPRRVDMEILDAVIEGMDAQRTVRHPGRGGRGFRNRTQARLRMMLWTGITPASLRQLRPHAVSVERGTLQLPPRRKGAGAEAVTLPLFLKALRRAEPGSARTPGARSIRRRSADRFTPPFATMSRAKRRPGARGFCLATCARTISGTVF